MKFTFSCLFFFLFYFNEIHCDVKSDEGKFKLRLIVFFNYYILHVSLIYYVHFCFIFLEIFKKFFKKHIGSGNITEYLNKMNSEIDFNKFNLNEFNPILNSNNTDERFLFDFFGGYKSLVHDLLNNVLNLGYCVACKVFAAIYITVLKYSPEFTDFPLIICYGLDFVPIKPFALVCRDVVNVYKVSLNIKVLMK